jgi:hypothetical protein
MLRRSADETQAISLVRNPYDNWPSKKTGNRIVTCAETLGDFRAAWHGLVSRRKRRKRGTATQRDDGSSIILKKGPLSRSRTNAWSRPRPWGRSWRRSRARCCCWTRLRTISTASIQVAQTKSAPDDHLTASPNRCVGVPCIGCIGETRGSPVIRNRIVPATRVEWDKDEVDRVEVVPGPNNHFIARPAAVCDVRASGALLVLVGVQLSAVGLYFPPVLITG